MSNDNDACLKQVLFHTENNTFGWHFKVSIVLSVIKLQDTNHLHVWCSNLVCFADTESYTRQNVEGTGFENDKALHELYTIVLCWFPGM